MTQAIWRTQHSGIDPNQALKELVGPAFADYRMAFQKAEEGFRPPAPLHLDIDVTTACNFRCPMCPAGGGHILPNFPYGQFLDPNLYCEALRQGAEFGLPSLRLGLTGEPLLVPDITLWVEEAKARGVLDIALITNASLLTPDLSRALIQAGLTRLMISIDAANAETYAKVRPGGDWELLLANIDAFLSLRAESGGSTPFLRLSFVEMDINQKEKDAFYEMFADRADYFTFQKYLNIFGSPETDFRPTVGLDTSAKGGRFCPEPFTRMALHADGGLFPCCADFGRQGPLGNLKNEDILSVWQSPDALALCGAEAADREPCCSCLAANL